MHEFRDFFTSYVETLEWTAISEDDSVDLRDYEHTYTLGQLLAMARDCWSFYREAVESGALDDTCDDMSLAGHDFALTRNRHGAGFWDGDWPEPKGSQLTDLSRPYGTQGIMCWPVEGDPDSMHVEIHS